MDPVRITTDRGVMTATLVDVENRNALGGAAKRLVHEVPALEQKEALRWASKLSADTSWQSSRAYS